MTSKEAAHEYWSQGHRIVLLKGKQPLHEWKKWETQKQTQEEFEALPGASADGFAIICGVQLNNGYYVGALDCDLEKGGKLFSEDVLKKQTEVLENMRVTQLEETPSGGKHLLYYSHSPVETKEDDRCGIEVLGSGKLCILAPSAEGKYRRSNDNTPSEVPSLNLEFQSALDKAGLKPSVSFPVTMKRRGKSKVRFCCEQALKRDNHLGHSMRLAIAAEHKKAGFSDQEVVELFRTQGDFDESTCLIQVKSAEPDKAASCESIAQYGYCYPECPKNKSKTDVKIVSGQPVQDIDPVPLAHLSMIEDPAVADVPVIVEGVVSSTSVSYLVPKLIEVTLADRDDNEEIETVEIGPKNPFNIKCVGVNEDIKYRRLKRYVQEAVDRPGSRVRRLEEKKWRTIYRIRVRPPVFTLEKREGKIVDERGFEYKAYDVFVCADHPITFEASSLIRLEGIVLPNPRSQNTTLLVYDLEFPEEFTAFDSEILDKLRKKLNGMTIEERVDWVLCNFEKFAQIVGRRNLALEGFLAFFTPLNLQLNGAVERGWGNVAGIGDTTTGKSATLKKLIMLLKAGTLITAESASAVGLSGSAVQTEKGEWTVDWGFLVLSDRKLLAIDGAHKLSFAQWAALAESERSGIVTIAKAAKNSAYARARLIRIGNAVDRESDKFSTKSMSAFLYPVQTISTVFDRTGIARLDLAVFADARDVHAEDVNKRLDTKHDKDLELLADALRWCWSNQAKIEFTDEAMEEILDSATRLYQTFFSESIPVVSIDTKFKLARLSSALAFMTLSTNDYKTVQVTKEHVEVVLKFIEEEYSRVGLNILAQEDRFEIPSTDDVEALINLIISKTELDRVKVEDMLKFIVLRGRVTRDELLHQFSLVDRNELRPLLAVLSSEGMLKSGRGLYATGKLVQTYKVLCSSTFATLAKIANPPEGTPEKKVEEIAEKDTEKITPSFPSLGNVGKYGKNQELTAPLTPESGDIKNTRDVNPQQSESPTDDKTSGPATILDWLRSEFQRGINQVLALVPLDPTTRGICPLCRMQGNLVWQVQFLDGSRVDACCHDCGGKIQDLIREFGEKST